MWDDLLQWDRDTFIYLNALGVSKYDTFWSVITEIYTWIPLFIFFIYLLYQKYPKKEAAFRIITVIALAIFISLITHWTKISMARLRPNNEVEINTLIRILKNPSDYSFFSGHASSSFSITVLIVLFLIKKWKWSLLFFLWPILFCMSRIYVGVHYPLDVIVGGLVGIASGIVFFTLYNRFTKRVTP
ncbi:MAG: phosphatase PAP2 family protein [Croceivirga sp.]